MKQDVKTLTARNRSEGRSHHATLPCYTHSKCLKANSSTRLSTCFGIRTEILPINRTHSICVRGQRFVAPAFRGGLALKAHRLLYHSTLGSRLMKKKKKAPAACAQPCAFLTECTTHVEFRFRSGSCRDHVSQTTSPPPESYLTQSVFKVVLQNSIPTRIRQRILYISNSNG